MVLAKLREQHDGRRGSSRQPESNVEQLRYVRIDYGVQPRALAAELNQRFFTRNVIWTPLFGDC
jgi:hypothetical protein